MQFLLGRKDSGRNAAYVYTIMSEGMSRESVIRPGQLRDPTAIVEPHHLFSLQIQCVRGIQAPTNLLAGMRKGGKCGRRAAADS